MTPADPHVLECVERALGEDLGELGDVTGRLSLPPQAPARARIVARAQGVVAGAEPARAAFLALDRAAEVTATADGQRIQSGDVVLRVHASAQAILAAERTALNFLQRLSGIATATAAFVDAVRGTGSKIYDTRKTTPGLRRLEKAAVRAGGGCNHRLGMFDQVLLKENNFALARPRTVEQVVRAAVAGSARLLGEQVPVIAEARDAVEAAAAVAGGARVILLDNFVPGPALREMVASLRALAQECGQPLELEASGGVRLDNVRAFAECGVDRISVGAITHSAPALDMSLLVEGLA